MTHNLWRFLPVLALVILNNLSVCKGQYDFEVDKAPDYIYNSQIGDIYYPT